MIIVMKKTANVVMLERVLSILKAFGFDNVQLKPKDEKGRICMAVLGQGADDISLVTLESLPGIENYARNSIYFENHQEDFLTVKQFFAQSDNSRKLVST